MKNKHKVYKYTVLAQIKKEMQGFLIKTWHDFSGKKAAKLVVERSRNDQFCDLAKPNHLAAFRLRSTTALNVFYEKAMKENAD